VSNHRPGQQRYHVHSSSAVRLVSRKDAFFSSHPLPQPRTYAISRISHLDYTTVFFPLGSIVRRCEIEQAQHDDSIKYLGSGMTCCITLEYYDSAGRMDSWGWTSRRETQFRLPNHRKYSIPQTCLGQYLRAACPFEDRTRANYCMATAQATWHDPCQVLAC
jgi:hypothetical protein